LSLKHWKLAATRITAVLDLLDAHPTVVLREDVEEEEEDVVSESIKEHGVSAAPLRVRGSLAAMVDRLDEEFNKSLLAMDIQSPEFAERLRDELVMYVLLLRSELYVRRIEDSSALYRVLLRRVEHAFFKTDALQSRMDSFVYGKHPELQKVHASIHDLCAFLYRNASDRVRTRAVLCHVYYYAIHDQFFRSRDMLLMSGLQESIHQADVPTQALFNRTMVQLGLCAFRQGLLKECHAALHEILTTGYARDLLNQGYFQVNMELVEAAYQTASMLLEVPFMAANPHDNGRRRVLSKTFRRMLESNERAAFQGPPENTRDHIMAAAKALFQGKWRESFKYLSAVRIWAYFTNPNDIRSILQIRVKEAGLATWVHLTGACSSSLSLDHLADTFELPLERTISLVSQMVVSGEIQGKLDGVNNTLVVTAPLNKVQWLSNQIADKLLHIADGHDKILEVRNQPVKPNKPHHHHHQNQHRNDNRNRKHHQNQSQQQNQSQNQGQIQSQNQRS
jgi:translation initiation factor 3 subunit C